LAQTTLISSNLFIVLIKQTQIGVKTNCPNSNIRLNQGVNNMAYVIQRAENPLDIQERFYGLDPERIAFGGFTSCIGIVAIRQDNQLIGIHLVLVDPDGNVFGADDADVKTVVDLVQENPRQVVIVGEKDCWDNPSAGPAKPAYEELRRRFNNPRVVDALPEDDTIRYRARKDGENIRVTFCVKSGAGPKPGQSSRSSTDFSTLDLADNIKFIFPDDITLAIVENIGNGKDDDVFTNVRNGDVKQNPKKKQLYVANPMGTQEDFDICVEDV
jgi:hypothetical protein